jgi:hypothetical protein
MRLADDQLTISFFLAIVLEFIYGVRIRKEDVYNRHNLSHNPSQKNSMYNVIEWLNINI